MPLFHTTAGRAGQFLFFLSLAVLAIFLLLGQLPLPFGRSPLERWNLPVAVLLLSLALLRMAEKERHGFLTRAGAWLAIGRRHWWPVAIGLAWYTITMGLVSARMVQDFKIGIWDVGVYEQQIWHILHDGRPWSSLLGFHGFGDHFTPILYPLSLLYGLWPCSLGLLWLQVLGLGLGVVPLYLFARRELPSPGLAWWVALAYLVYLPLRKLVLFPFHPETFAGFFLFSAFYCWRTGRRVWGILFLLLLSGTRETLLLSTASFGLYLFLHERRRLPGALLVLGSLGALALLLSLVIPWFHGPGSTYAYYQERYPGFGNSTGELLATMAIHPGKVLDLILTAKKMKYLRDLLAPWAFLPLLAPTTLLLALPGLFIHLLSPNPSQTSIHFQYTTDVYPWLVIAAVFGLARLCRGWKTWENGGRLPGLQRRAGLAAPLLLVAFPLFYFRDQPMTHFFGPAPASRTASLRRLIELIPPEASVTTFDTAVPSLCRRSRIYQLSDTSRGPDYLLLDTRTLPYAQPPFNSWEYYRGFLQGYRQNPAYRVEKEEEGFLLLRRVTGNRPSPAL